MSSIALILAISLPSAVEFPMTADGKLGVFKFFDSDVAHFVYGEIAARVTPVEAGRFSTRLGFEMDTYMGESWNNPDMKFNIYGDTGTSSSNSHGTPDGARRGSIPTTSASTTSTCRTRSRST